jgi:hypothetical protein
MSKFDAIDGGLLQQQQAATREKKIGTKWHQLFIYLFN